MALGQTPGDVRNAIEKGTLSRIRRGWLSFAYPDEAVVEAVRQGGVLGCASALAHHGAWDLRDCRLHIYRSQRERQKLRRAKNKPRTWKNRNGRTLTLCACPSPKTRLSSDLGVLSLREALLQAAFCLAPDDLLIVVESMIHRKLMTDAEVRATLGGLRVALDRNLKRLDVAESGTETLVRLRLRGRGVQLKPQVSIDGVGRIDFLIGKRLVIEVDSQTHHDNPEAYFSDRRRDLDLVDRDYIVVRLTYEDVMSGWEAVEPKILGIIQRGLHVRERRVRAVRSTSSQRR
ncbi:DUF559 domain-containing protein [Ammonicoccus fulvus]|uniref:DUF559 domain-containing protein n=1 Tax=Ammonicoccus fulvus TaxID=3138240 RepID=A0ABZ3FPU1_9ACTN